MPWTTPETYVDETAPALTAAQFNTIVANLQAIGEFIGSDGLDYKGTSLPDVGGTWTTVATKTYTALRSTGFVAILAVANRNYTSDVARVTVDGAALPAGPYVTIPPPATANALRTVRLQYRQAPTILAINFRDRW